MNIVSLDSLAICVILGTILIFLTLSLLLLSILKVLFISRITLSLIFIISISLIIVPLIILSQASYIYPRMGYGYFANVNNAIRFTHSLNKPLVMEKFTNITNKEQPNMIIEPINDSQLNYINSRQLLDILRPVLPISQDLDEHRFPKNYEPNILTKRRNELYTAFHKHYTINHKILNKTSKFDNLFQKGAIGAHIRFTGHYINKSIDFDEQIKAYTDYIDKSNYQYVYLATHLKDVEDIFRNKYGSRLIINKHYRNPDKTSDWTSNNLKQEEEDTNVLIDMILLSKCKEIVGGPSNVFCAALWYNPKLNFYIPDIFTPLEI
jgi:hypothetical protein